jgi:hypothetical protein
MRLCRGRLCDLCDFGRRACSAEEQRRSSVDLEPEDVWLRHRLRRLRAILRLVKEPAAEGILRELIADAEDRLDLLEKVQTEKLPKD